MNHDIIIRTSLREDFQQLIDLDNKVWDESLAPVKIHWSSVAEYEDKCPPGNQLVAVIRETICGYLGFNSPTNLPSNKHVSEINLAVLPSYQRMGIGKRLIEAAKNKSIKEGIIKLSLRVLSTNKSAIAFYKDCGFIEQGQLVQEFKLNGHYVDDVLMYLLLKDMK